jgi:hypothetical protein
VSRWPKDECEIRMSLIPPPHGDRQASAYDEDVAQQAF